MALTTFQTLACLQLMDKDKVLALGKYAQQNNIALSSSAALRDCIRLNAKIPVPSTSEMERATNSAQRVLDESNENGIQAVSYFDALFPPPLKTIWQHGKNVCPVLLYYKGDIALLQDSIGVAIIGTRQPTPEGVAMGRYFGKAFADEGFNIVSGLALGCDAAAHRGAIDAHGVTTAFVAHGLDTVHPKENSDLAVQILDSGGLLISEYPIGTPLAFSYLVERNRLQAGLADATIVVQTDVKKGGSMHAVNTSIENKKPVFAMQYSANLNTHPMVGGNIKLLSDKQAQPLRKDNVQEVVEAILKTI
jgi:DNA processing protein